MIQVLGGNPQIQPGSVRFLLDPSKHELVPGLIYEYVYHIPDWGIIDDVLASFWEWWKENVEGIDVIGHYREGDNLVFQVRRKGTRVKLKSISPLGIPLALAIILGLAAILAVFGVVFLAFGLRFASAGFGLLAASLITFILASGYYKLLGVPLGLGGFYLLAKQFGVV